MSDLRRSRAARIAMVATAYAVTAKIGFALAGPPGNVTAVWPPSGIALGALLVWGRFTWPGIWLGSFVANVWFFRGLDPHLTVSDYVVSTAIGAGSTVQALLGAYLIRRFTDFDPPFSRPSDIVGFALLSATACGVAASVGLAALAVSGSVPPGELGATWSRWYLGDLVGVLVVAPLIVTWSRGVRFAWRPGRTLEAAALALLATAAAHGVYGAALRTGAAASPREALFLPLVVWAAVRFGRRGATLVSLTVAALVVVETHLSLGPDAAAPDSVLLWTQAFSGIVALTGLLLAASIAEQRDAERSLRAAHRDLEARVVERTEVIAQQAALLRGLFEHAPDAILALDHRGIVVRANERVNAVFGWRADELVGKSVEVLLPATVRESHILHRAAYADRPHTRTMGAGLDLHACRKDGSQIPVDIMLSPLETKEGPMVIAIVRDITRRKVAEDRLQRTTDQLRALAAHVQDMTEKERARMSREVHDQLGQALTGLKMELTLTARQLAASDDAGAREGAERVRDLMSLIDGMIESVRRIASDLRPGILDELGLLDAIRWQGRDFERRSGMTCHVTGTTDGEPLDRATTTALFRIFQEILANVARHARGTRVTARLAIGDGAVTLEVADDGRGITEEEKTDRRSLGLLGMRERAAMLGGEVSVHGDPGRGTTVSVRIPRLPRAAGVVPSGTGGAA